MKKLLGTCIIGVLMASGMAYGLNPLPDLDTAVYPLRGESNLLREGRASTVDWIVSNTALTSNISQASFVFAYDFSSGGTKGDYTAYAEESTWYYYYQVENTSGNFGTSFSLHLDPDLIVSAGFILSVDLDTGLDISHLDTDPGLAGEFEPAPSAPVNFVSASFDPYPPTPNASLNFFPGLASGRESTVFFLTSNAPPEYFIAELLCGPQGPEGLLPIPMVIPEPASILLLGGASIIALRLRKNRN